MLSEYAKHHVSSIFAKCLLTLCTITLSIRKVHGNDPLIMKSLPETGLFVLTKNIIMKLLLESAN